MFKTISVIVLSLFVASLTELSGGRGNLISLI